MFSPPSTSRLLTGDLLQGLNEWRNIQDVVRQTFKAFHNVLQVQGDKIKVLEAGMEGRATRAELATALQGKADSKDTMKKLRELEQQLSDKADVSDMERRALRAEVDAALRTQMGDVYAVLNAKSDDREIKVWREQSDRQVQQLRADVSRLSTQLGQARPLLDATTAQVAGMQAVLAAKADVADVDDQMRDKVNRRLFSEMLSRKADLAVLDQLDAELRARVEDALAAAERKAEAADMHELASRAERMRQRMEADADTTATALRTLGATFDGALAAVGTQITTLGSQQDQLRGQVGSHEREARERDTELAKALDTKADAAQMLSRLEVLVDAATVSRLSADVDLLAEALDRKADAGRVDVLAGQVSPLLDLPHQLEACSRHVDALQGAHAQHAASVEASMTTKAAVDDVNKALAEVCTELQARASAELLATSLRQQATLNERFAASTSGARWVWHSGSTRAGGLVPWNAQAYNSDPACFVWEQDKTTIYTTEPGLYEVSFAVFSARRRPLVQLLVNGEPAASAVGGTGGTTTLSLVKHASQKLSQGGGLGSPGRPSSSSGGGGSLSPTSTAMQAVSSSAASASGRDYFALPALARLTLVCQGADTERLQGFLALHRL